MDRDCRIPFMAKKSELWPPLKSARYCKKQLKRNCKGRGITPSKMLMHESSINHHRVTLALNELTRGSNSDSTSSSNNITCVFDVNTINNSINSQPFWSKKTCQEFWNEYLECDTEFSFSSLQSFSLLSLKEQAISFEDDTCPKYCYAKITKSIRKLLKRTFTGAACFSELESLVKSLPFPSPRGFSCGQVLSSSETGATIKLDTPFHRVWLHAICQYHGLSSQSKTIDDTRLVHIKMSKKAVKIPRLSLYNYLLQLTT